MSGSIKENKKIWLRDTIEEYSIKKSIRNSKHTAHGQYKTVLPFNRIIDKFKHMIIVWMQSYTIILKFLKSNHLQPLQ